MALAVKARGDPAGSDRMRNTGTSTAPDLRRTGRKPRPVHWRRGGATISEAGGSGGSGSRKVVRHQLGPERPSTTSCFHNQNRTGACDGSSTGAPELVPGRSSISNGGPWPQEIAERLPRDVWMTAMDLKLDCTIEIVKQRQTTFLGFQSHPAK